MQKKGFTIAIIVIIAVFSVSIAAGMEVIPSNSDVNLTVSNDGGAWFNDNLDNTYNFFNPSQSASQGLNALHITTDASNSNGQVTISENQSGTFYLTDTGGRGWDDDCILMLAVNGTVPDDFRVTIKASGYRWVPVPTGTYPAYDTISYIPVALQETFTKGDFLYGPQIWKPCPGANYPIFDGQNMGDTSNTFSIMFIDLNTGILGAGTLGQSGFIGQSISDNGAIKVEYSFENLETYAVFNGYAYTVSSNQGQGIRWTNRVSATGSSGYSVTGVLSPAIPPVASFTADPLTGDAPLAVQFTDSSTGSPTSWAWTFGDGGTSTGQNPSHQYTSAGHYTVSLTVANADGSDSEVKTDFLNVTGPSSPSVLPAYNNIFVNVANDAGVKYDFFGNDTYNIRFEGINRGLNALHISTDPSVNFGQVTMTDRQSGTFYATDSGGKGYEDEILLLVAVNGTIPDDFSMRITSDGYTWTPNPVPNQPPSLNNVTYQAVALDETFTKADFIYGPQIWKPTGNEVDYPLFAGQDLGDTGNTFQLMFVDLNAGVLRPNTSLVNQGAVRINYSFQNPGSFTAFSVYAYCNSSNNGDGMVAWTNALTPDKAMSGYSVYRAVPPETGFEANVTSGPAPLSVQFTDTSTNSPTSWSWDFGDSSTSTEQNPSHQYTSAGTYTVTLTTTNAGGSDSEVKSDFVAVTALLPDPPVVNFIGEPRSGPAPLVVHFTDQSTNNPTSWAWDFENDGIIDSSLQNPTHTYTAPGTYQVNLTASNAGGNGNRLKGNYIQVTTPGDTNPVVDFNADSRSGTAPFTVHFTDQTVTAPTAWVWDFENDGIIDSSLQNPVHTYTAPGTYQVKLTATNSSGTASRLKANYITVLEPSGPTVATVTVTPDSASLNTGGARQFAATAYDAGGSGIPGVAWSWTSSDESVGTVDETGYFTAISAGTTVITAETEGVPGTADVEVHNAPEISAGFTASPETGRAPCIVRFTDTSTGAGITGYEWDFGDGTTSTQQNPTHIYRSAGTYTVTLEVSSATGSDTATGTFVVTGSGSISPVGNVKAQFTTAPTVGRAPLEVHFTDKSTGADSWNWDFGDGSTSTEQSPDHVYARSGIYRITLEVQGAYRSDSATGVVMVVGTSISPGGLMKARFTASPTVGRNPLEVRFTDQSNGATSWNWDFDDGTGSTEQNPVHVFTGKRMYKVTLVTTIGGSPESASKTIWVL